MAKWNPTEITTAFMLVNYFCSPSKKKTNPFEGEFKFLYACHLSIHYASFSFLGQNVDIIYYDFGGM
jgi:hypothetical protein